MNETATFLPNYTISFTISYNCLFHILFLRTVSNEKPVMPSIIT